MGLSLKFTTFFLISLFYFALKANDKFGQSLTYKEGQHVPLIMIIDQTKFESPTGDDVADVDILDIALRAKYIPILVSKNILYNYAYRKQDWSFGYNINFKDTNFSKKEWELYTPKHPNYFIDDDQFFLILPKTNKAQFNSLFNFKNLKRLDILPHYNNNDYDDLLRKLALKWPVPKKIPLKNMPDDLGKIFITITYSKETSLAIHQPKAWEGPILDVYLTGHGELRPPLISTFTPDEIQTLLTFFNNKLRLGALIISSCFVGGENLRNFKFKKDINNEQIFYPLNFIIMVQSVGDLLNFTASRLSITGKQFFISIFDILKNLGKDEQHSFESLLKDITILDQSSSIHVAENIPQIILPGGIEIQSLTPSDNVLVLGKVKAEVAEIENKPIFIYPKRRSSQSKYEFPLNVLVYPEAIMSTLIIQSSYIKDSLKGKIQNVWQYLPTFADLVRENKSIIKHYKTFFTSDFSIATLEASNYLYPNILSMIHGNASHYFKKIVFKENALDGTGGVLMGIRDSFLNIAGRPTKKKFCIDTLEGPNDISLILKTIRIIRKNLKKLHTLETLLPKNSDDIILKNITIKTQAKDIDPIETIASIKFQIKDTAWGFKYNSRYWLPEYQQYYKPQLWDFKQINITKYEKEYQKSITKILKKKLSATEPQKSLIEILKEKIVEQKKPKFEPLDALFELSSTLGQLSGINR